MRTDFLVFVGKVVILETSMDCLGETLEVKKENIFDILEK
jgi:hypothetical protein